MGDPGSENKENGPTPGLYLLAAQDIFTIVENVSGKKIIYIKFFYFFNYLILAFVFYIKKIVKVIGQLAH